MKTIYTGLIVILPILMMYKFPFAKMSCVTILVLLFSPVFLIKALKGICGNFNIIWSNMPLFLYFMWAISKCVGSPIDLILFAATYIYITAIVVSNIFDINKARKIIENISIIASIIVILQYVLHYTSGLTLPTVCVYDWLNDYMKYSIQNKDMTGFFRPSAFFAEPAHFAYYSVIGIVSILFTESKVNIKKAVFITLGILLTTSGIGIIFSSIIWFVWLLKGSPKNRTSFLKIFGGLTSGLLTYYLLMQFNFFSNAIQRIFGEVDGYNAISGRLFWWDTYFSRLSTHDWIFGLGYSALPGVYFTGFMEIVYASGIIGLILLSMAIMNCIRHTKGFHLFLCIIFFGLLFSSDLTSFFYMIFWFSLIYSGYIYKKKQSKTNRGRQTYSSKVETII